MTREEFDQQVNEDYPFVCATLVKRFRLTPEQARDAVHRKIADLLDPLKGAGYKNYEPTRGLFTTWLTDLAYKAYADTVRENKKWLFEPLAAHDNLEPDDDDRMVRAQSYVETSPQEHLRKLEDAIGARVDRQALLTQVSLGHRDLLFRKQLAEWRWVELEKH